jgi:hypothetical protein
VGRSGGNAGRDSKKKPAGKVLKLTEEEKMLTLSFLVSLAGHAQTGAPGSSGSNSIVGAGGCTNKVVTAVNLGGAPTCTTLTSAYVDSSIAPTTSLPPNSTAAPWLTVGHVSQTNGAPFSGSANKASFYGIILNAPKTTSQMTYFVGTTADNTSNTYDFGIYSGTSGGTCTLQAHLGATAGTTLAPAASAWHTVSWTGGSVTLPPGRYYLALTSSATTAQFTTGTDSAELTFLGSVGNVNIATGGSLPASVTCPADSYTTAGAFPAWSIN